MKESNSNSNTKTAVKLLVGVLGVLIFMVSYFLLLPNLQAQTETLEKENEILKEQQKTVNDLAVNEETYAQQAELFEQEIAEIIEKYPVCVLEEDAILFGRRLEKNTKVSISMVGMNPANLLYSLKEQVAPPAETTETENSAKGGVDLGILDESTIVCPDYNLYCVAASYDFASDYKHMKSAFAEILSHSDKRNVPELALTRDDKTGMLIGTLTVNLYYMTNTGKIYEKPDPGEVIKGSNNPFGTLELPDRGDLPARQQDAPDEQGDSQGE